MIARALAACAVALALCGCQTIGSAYDRMFGSSTPSVPPTPLETIQPRAEAYIVRKVSVGGAGKFTAKGTLAQATSARAMAAANVEWQAIDFTLVNRPDLRLVADGKGTLSLEDRKVALAGNIDIDEGRVQFEPSKVGTLSDDVVIVGQERKTQDAGLRDLPLRLDLRVTLGRDFRIGLRMTF